MARTWLSIRVELVQGRGGRFWPRPGRIIAAARSHTFAQLSSAIDEAFARWDRSHLWAFMLPDGTRIEVPDLDSRDEPDDTFDGGRVRLGRLKPGERFVYEFDFGDSWIHICTAGERVDPMDTLGVIPARPLPYRGWGNIPDQYGRRWEDDDGESAPPPDPGWNDLPDLVPWNPAEST
jgi:hypothetical protein